MSASREKKQRQSAGPSEKDLKAQQEQAVRKRKTITYSVIAAVAVVLVTALLVWRSGFFQARTAAATVGDETLTTAELSFYYYGVRSSYANNSSYYGSLGMLSSGFDSSKSDDEQFYDATNNVTYRDYFMETALENAQQNKALAEQALADGHTEAEIKQDLQDYIAARKQEAASRGYSYASYLRAIYGPYMSTGVYEELTSRNLLANLVANEKYDELFDGYTQTDLDAYYKDNADTLDTVEYSFLYFPIATVGTTDPDGNQLPDEEVEKLKEEAKNDAKAKAEEALKAYDGGTAVADLATKYELTSYKDHTQTVGTGSIDSAYSEQLLKLAKDESALVESASGFYVIAFHDRYLADEPTRDVRHILIRAETATDDSGKVVAPTDEAWAAAKAKIDAIQAEWESGSKTEDAFAELANRESDDGNGTTGGLYTRAFEGYFVPEFSEWTFDSSRQPGDVGMVQHKAADNDYSKYWGYHLIYPVGDNEPVWMGTARNSLAVDARTTWIDELAAAHPTALADGADYLGK